jgi:hypothetical protein
MPFSLHEQVKGGEFGAIVLDTSIFDGYQLELESGLLRQIEQFADGSVRVLMPDVIRHEVVRHLQDRASEARSQLQRALRLSQRAGLLGGHQVQCEVIVAAATDAATSGASEARLQAWIDRTGAAVIRCGEFVDVTTLMERYFATRPPFAATGDKKCEFPDAVVLLALERWAVRHRTRVLLISRDEDWQSFASESEHLAVVPDLAEALAAFQDHRALYACRRAAQALEAGDPMGIGLAVREAATEQLLDALQIRVVATSGGRPWVIESMDFMPVEVTVAAGPEEFRFTPVQLGDDVFTMRARLKVEVGVGVRVWMLPGLGADGEVDEEVRRLCLQQEPTTLDAMVTFTGKIPDRMAVHSVEILPASLTVNLGELRHG